MSPANVYYSPERFGLTVVAEAEAGGGYEFDTFVVWRHESGYLTWASDHGCSCPTPFDDVNPHETPRGTARDALNDLAAWVAETDYGREARKAAAVGAAEILAGLMLTGASS